MFRRCEILQLYKIEAKTKRLNVLFLVRTLRLQNDSRLTKTTDSNIYKTQIQACSVLFAHSNGRQFQTTCDDKSSYQHLLLHPSSQTYFGFQWHGFFFVVRTIPFGWKAIAFIYHKLGLAVSGAVRSLWVSASQNIDDQHVRQLFIPPLLVSWTEPRQPLISSAHWDWTFHRFEKLQLVPSKWTRFLGFIPEDKKVKFAALREDVISSPFVGLKTLQHFSGKVISFSFSIHWCRLYVGDVFKAISRLSGSTRSRSR